MSELIPWVVAIVVGIASAIISWYYFHRQAQSQEEELRLKKKEVEELQKQNQNMRKLLDLKKGEIGYNIVKDVVNFFQSRQDADDEDDYEDYG